MNKDTKMGRPRISDQRQRKRNITLSDDLAEKAKEIGDGNISRGIRRALEVWPN